MSTKTQRISPSNIYDFLNQQVNAGLISKDALNGLPITDSYAKKASKAGSVLVISNTLPTSKKERSFPVTDALGNKLVNPLSKARKTDTYPLSQFKKDLSKNGNPRAHQFKDAHKDLSIDDLYTSYKQTFATELQQEHQQLIITYKQRAIELYCQPGSGKVFNETTGNIVDDPALKPKKHTKQPQPQPQPEQQEQDGNESDS
jgi:hypothetical protein